MHRWHSLLQVVFIALLAPTLVFAAPLPGDPLSVAPPIAAPDLSCDACKIVLLDPGSAEKDPVDTQIAQTQARVRSSRNPGPQVERLGWLFVEKARVSNDPGFYKLAEQCALCLESANSNSPEALLLKGHVLHSLHRFKEAEPLALDLVKRRGLAFDFGLLGDVEYDQGKIPEAVAAYQKMVDLRPDLQAYSRVAQVRWITGDLPGAVEAMDMAAQAGSPLNAEPTAWTYSRLALLQLQSGDVSGAKRSASAALEMQTNSAPALLALGRIQLATDETNTAIEFLREAAALNHLPESQWILADTLRAAGNAEEAARVEKELQQRGASEDPRSFSLYLATRGRQPELALKLAQRELGARGDVFTHDALAWALKANGRLPESQAEMTKALAEGTQDARLFFHAAVINGAAGNKDEAVRYSRLAWDFRQMLFPSELEQLCRIAPREECSQQRPSNLKPN
jgi:tetratricopeptide (TPR) repeat protein